MIRTLNKIKRIELYTTSKNHKLRACDVRSSTGADVVINGTLFNYDTWKPVCDVKAKGKVLSDDPYAYRGLAWNAGDTDFSVALTKDMPKWDNFISCVFLINAGKDLPLDSVTPDVKRPAARTAIFKTADGKTHFWCDKAQMRLEQLRSALRRQGDVVWAMALDGGGSSQLSQAGDDYIYSSRKVQNYICVWLDTGGDSPKTDSHYTPTVRAYSLKADGEKKVGKHFRVREFACGDGTDPIFIAEMLPRILDDVRDHFGKPVIITSGYRTPPWNNAVGGKEGSQHLYGLAADIQIHGVSPSEVADYVRHLMPNFGGVGRYKNFTHVDVRAHTANW